MLVHLPPSAPTPIHVDSYSLLLIHQEKCLEGYDTTMEKMMLAESRILLHYGPHVIIHPLASITLHAATACGFAHIIQYLRNYIKAEDFNNQAQTTTKPSCLHLAAMHNRLKIVRLLIKSRADVNICDTNMETPIWMSVREKNLKIVNILLKAGATITGLNIFGKSLIQEAVETGYADMVRVLLQKGAQPLLDLTKRGKGLNNEIFSNDPQLKKQMLKVFVKHLKNTDVDGDDVALWAMKLGDPDILRGILKIDKNLINGRNKITGLNLLHHAVDLNHQEFVRYFECLEEFEMDLDQFCFAEETPLYRAIQNRRFENAAILVKYKANCELGSRNPQHSSIALANFLKQEYLVEFMIAAGSAPPPGWNRKLGIDLQSISIIAIRNLIPQAGFRKKVHLLQKKLPKTLIKLLLLE